MELINEDIFPTLFLSSLNPVHPFLALPYSAVSTVTNILHLVDYIFSLRLGISDMINMDMIKIETENIINQKSVYFIYFFVYGFRNGSLFVHSHGGHVLENKHQQITNNKMMINTTPIMI